MYLYPSFAEAGTDERTSRIQPPGVYLRQAVSPHQAQGPMASRRKLPSARSETGTTFMWAVGGCPHRQRFRAGSAAMGASECALTTGPNGYPAKNVLVLRTARARPETDIGMTRAMLDGAWSLRGARFRTIGSTMWRTTSG